MMAVVLLLVLWWVVKGIGSMWFARWLFLFFIEILYIYSRAGMNQRPFSPVTGEAFKVENYYFQLILQRLIAKRPPPTATLSYTFTPFKGSQKYESSRPIVLQLGSSDAYSLDGARLNFVAISYNPNKGLSFAIRMIENGKASDKEVGEYLLDANNFIDHFTLTDNGAFTIKMDFNDDWAAEAELYVERSRYGVERLVKDVKNPKPKENGEAVAISHQAINAQRMQLDLEEGEEAPHANRFKKFSPKRESSEDLQKKNQHFNRKNEQPVKIDTVLQQKQEVKKEDKKSPKGEFVPKKEWIIPEAEKYMASKTKTSSRSNSIQVNQKAPSVLKEEKAEQRRRPKTVEQPSFLEKLPIQPKYLVLVAIVVAFMFAASFFLKSEPPQDLLQAPKLPKPKKNAEKAVKSQKTVKVKK